MKSVALMLAFSVLCSFRAEPSIAGAVYSWIDENGVKHFSTQPPPMHVQDYETRELIPYDAQADRERMQREKQRRAEEARREKREPAQEAARERYERRREQIQRLEAARQKALEKQPEKKGKTAAQRKRLIGY